MSRNEKLFWNIIGFVGIVAMLMMNWKYTIALVGYMIWFDNKEK